MRTATIAGAGLLLVAAWVASRQRSAADATLADVAGTVAGTVAEGVAEIMASISGYSPESVPAQYREAIATAETANGIPAGLLARLLWQESRYRPEIISGAKRSPVGAIGIAQFMPATAAEWGVDPRDAFASIAGAGRYLAWLRARVQTWGEVLAAYNWGIGNVQRKGLARAPVETRNYYTQILADLGIEGGIA